MKIRPVILCGGAGTRLWPKAEKHQAKQFIDFGNWTLLGKTLERVKASIFDAPIISTNAKYLRQVKQHLKKHKIRKFKIVLEPAKRNTAPAILSTALIKDIPIKQPLMFLAADHLIEKVGLFNKAIKKNQKKLTQNNIFIFGIKPKMPSSEFGYFLTRNNKVSRFVEKPKEAKAKQIISKKGYWNSGMFYLRKDSIINNFKKYQPNIYRNCNKAVTKAKYKSNVYYINKQAFTKATAKSFDYAILEKTKDINAIKLDIPWSDLGSWKEICKMYGRNKRHYFKKKNVFHRPWGSYVNLFNGKEFLIKELYVKPKGILSLQKHFHRSEHWVVVSGTAKVEIDSSIKNIEENQSAYIPVGSKHRLSNPGKKNLILIEIQSGSYLGEDDIHRFEDNYGRIYNK